MFQTLKTAFKNKELRNKILLTLGLLFIFRLGSWIPVPGINIASVTATLPDNTIFQLLSAIGGNALQNGALLAIGIAPYINASIITQLLTIAIPKLEQWSKQGEDGRKKIEKVTRWLTLVLGLAQSIGIAASWNSSRALLPIFPGTSTVWVAVVVAAIMLAGAMFTMWLGERITEIGIGNGMSLLIFVGIIASAGLAIYAEIEGFVTRTGSADAVAAENLAAMWRLIAFFLVVFVIFFFIVFIDNAERRIPVQYAKQVKGNKVYGGQSTHIPIKVNANGVLPIIFATAIITFPLIIVQFIASFSANDPAAGTVRFLNFWQDWFSAGGNNVWGSVIFFVLQGLLILGFSYFYAQIQFKPDEVARNLQQHGGTITGIRPGAPTAEYLKKISKRLTLFGAIFLTIIATVPAIVFSIAFRGSTGLVNAFSATGMLIVVSVALEIRTQLESQLMMKHYKGFLK
ncbi:MAG: preprotein translocase subunit SecY [Firmicutes bacterium]|nr:preprotein translocase subunit SecY [Bacillota bacterium]